MKKVKRLQSDVAARRGQSLVEYLVLTCLVAVAAIAVVSVVGRNIRENYANISNALRGEGRAVKHSEVQLQALDPKGFQNYMENSDVGAQRP
jgi:Flp pilus assembly pilin Flp